MEFLKYNPSLAYSYAYGAFVTLELLTHRKDKTIAILIDESFVKNDAYLKIKELVKDTTIKLIINDKIIKKIRPKENIFVIGVFQKYHSTLQNNVHILLNQNEDYGQIGTIIRSMNGFAFHDIVFVNNTKIDVFDPKLIRASMGSFFNLNFLCLSSIADYQNVYHQQKIMVVEQTDKKEDNHQLVNKNLTLIFSKVKVDGPYEHLSFRKNLDLENIINIILFNLYN